MSTSNSRRPIVTFALLVILHSAHGSLPAVNGARSGPREQVLTFEYVDGRVRDKEAAGTWDITGKAIAGPMQGKQLKPIAHGDYFAFSWLAFKPQTEIFKAPATND